MFMHFTFKFMIHFELLFLKAIVSMSGFSVYLFGMQMPNSSTIVENTIPSPLDCFCSFVKNQVTVFVWVYLWALTPLTYLSHFFANITLSITVALQ